MYAPLIPVDLCSKAKAPVTPHSGAIEVPKLRHALQQALDALRRTPPAMRDPEWTEPGPNGLCDVIPSTWDLHQAAIAAVQTQIKDLDSLSVDAVKDDMTNRADQKHRTEQERS